MQIIIIILISNKIMKNITIMNKKMNTTIKICLKILLLVNISLSKCMMKKSISKINMKNYLIKVLKKVFSISTMKELISIIFAQTDMPVLSSYLRMMELEKTNLILKTEL